MLAVFTVYQHTDNGTGSISGTLSRAIVDANDRAGDFLNEIQTIRFQFNDVNHDNPYVTFSGNTTALPLITASKVTIDGIDLQLTTADQRVIIKGSATQNVLTSFRYDGSASEVAGHFYVHDLRFDTIEGDAIRIVGLGTDDRVTIDNIDVQRSSPAFDINGQPTLGTGSGVYFAATPSGPLGRFEIKNSYFYRNAGTGIVVDSSLAPTAATATSEISLNIIGYDPVSFTTSGNGTNSAGIRLGNGAAKIDILSNAIYTANKPAVEITSAAGSAIRLGVNASQDPNVFQSANAYSTEGSPFDLLADGVPLGNDPGDGDPGPNGLQNKPTLLPGGITFASNVWSVPMLLEAGVYDLTAYRFDSVTQKWSFYQQQGNTTFSSSTTPASMSLFTSNGWLAGQRLAIVATNKSTNVNSSSEFSEAISLTAALRGDYSRNGIVDKADYITYRNTLGTSVTPFTGADGDGNGVITVTDYVVWRSNFGATAGGGAASGAAFVPGDYNEDGIVDEEDFDVWFDTLGSETNLAADGNFNGIVDLADLQVWQEMRGVTTSLDPLDGDFNDDGVVDTADYDLWVAGDASADADGDTFVLGDTDDFNIWQANFGHVRADVFPLVTNGTQGKPLEIPDAAPVVLTVKVGGYDYAAVDGSGEQLRSLPVANPNAVSIRFSEEVYVTQAALQVINLDGTSPSSATSFVYDLATQTATWTFGATFADGRTLLRLSDSVFDLDHEALDGEFANPWTLSQAESSTLPSGDGEAGGEFRFRFTVLAGDTDHNNIHGAVNYQNWKSYEPGMIYVSKTGDEIDSDLSFGDVSLREAVNYANGAGEPTTIVLPAGEYDLTYTGGGASQADLDVTGSMTIVGDGPGLSIINGGYNFRIFDVANLGVLSVSRLTLALGHGVSNSDNRSGAGVRVQNGGVLHMDNCAVVGNETGGWGLGGGIYFAATASGSIESSVITANWAEQDGGGVYVEAGTGEAVTLKSTIIANNTISESETPDIVGGNRLVSNGYNRFTSYAGFTLHTTDFVAASTVHYIVTSVADTYDGDSDPVNMSLRDAIHQANITGDTQEIWLPAWTFVLTLQRTTQQFDMDVSFGDLDILDSLAILGIGGATGPATSVAWMPGAVADKVFELVGDYNSNKIVGSGDPTNWTNENGLSGPGLSADGDDDGDVDQADYNIYSTHWSNTLTLDDVDVA